jgi:steroid delta-isomerase-like uncharacterized protein
MSVEANVTIVQRHFDLLRHYDEAGADAIWAQDIVFREPHQVIQGRDAGKRRYGEFRAAFPDIEATLHEVVAQDDKVVARYTLEGTHQAPFAGISATGKRVTLSGMGMFRLVDGRIVEGWGCADFFGFLQQLGAISTPGQPAASGQRS